MTKKTIAALLLTMGMVALGFGQIRPQMILVSTTPTSVTLQVQAGSDPLPYGFEVSFQASTGLKRTLTILSDGGSCSGYALLPGQISPPFTVDGVTNTDCLTYNQTKPLTCATAYRFFAKAGDILSTGITVSTSACN